MALITHCIQICKKSKTHNVFFKEKLILQITPAWIILTPGNYGMGCRAYCNIVTNYLQEVFYQAKLSIRNGDYVYSDKGNREVTFEKNEGSLQIYIGKLKRSGDIKNKR